ncbi:hypothetical protein BBK36DRAFT_1128347 [Trichoderma citrinoviride]|uniref:Zn(2)-C6 fungal-type domain-containing protein n=1 Tax=Trichoderma citrinoviride TaxID=58853 RepID=A0A2T4B100_9HYPO|nr:hypothetical protein BBK36DRAFT_1128347 [Trichoderma citrinoviride]PTB62994.1 hypothetical protein BBK36DRAFT_1128347 [Trichoderma citrinoviride]
MGSSTTTTGEGTRQQPGLACEECRRRKARCDRVRPKCGICADSGRNCVVLDKRSQRGPKKGQLKDLRSRLMLLEQRLVGQDDALNMQQERDSLSCPTPSEKVSPERDFVSSSASTDIGLDTAMSSTAGAFALFGSTSGSDKMPPLTPDLTTATTAASMASCICKGWQTESGMFSTSPFPQIPITPQSTTAPSRMSSMSLATADPVMPDVRVHPFAPMVHKRRYYAWASDANVSPARTALRSAMRTIASAMSPQFCDIGQVMYASTRRMLETQDACPDTGLPWMTRLKPPHEQPKIDHERIQAWLLLAYYDVLRRSEHQAFITARRAFRLLRLSGLCEMDVDACSGGQGHVATCTPPAETSWNMQMCPSEGQMDEVGLQQDWVSVEEKRRTIWSAFLLDRLSTMVNDQPTMLMEEMVTKPSHMLFSANLLVINQLYTRLPMSEVEFQSGAQEPVSQMCFLVEATDGNKAGNGINSSLTPFAHCVVVANLFARCMTHCKLAMQSPPLSAPEAQDFWIRHQWLASAAANACESAVTRCDPMLVFTRILAFSASLSLCSTANATSWQTLDHHLMAMACKPAAHQAASQVVRIIKTAPRIAFFKMHPFFPNAIALVASFLNADVPYLPSTRSSNAVDTVQERQDAVNELLAALRRSSQVNNLAAELLCKLELDIGQTASDGSVSQFDQADGVWT